MSDQIILGSTVTDKITGFKGTAVSRTEYLHDAPSIGVEAAELSEGKPVLSYFTETRLVVNE